MRKIIQLNVFTGYPKIHSWNEFNFFSNFYTAHFSRLMKIFNKIHMFLDSVSFVALHTWKFDTTNVQKMLAELNEVDRKNFNFDMSARNINWKKMLEISTCGITFYLFKENLLKSDEKAKKRYFW